ncbi:hypothetical protein LDENG_00062480 [Lucifuga dentata]|nr:hypothetical protein LDENG_00062480 [Lucifuga dentata]
MLVHGFISSHLNYSNALFLCLSKAYKSSPIRAIRSSDKGLLMVPLTLLKTQGDCAFQTLAPKLWNSVPLTLWPLSKGSLKLIFYFFCVLKR